MVVITKRNTEEFVLQGGPRFSDSLEILPFHSSDTDLQYIVTDDINIEKCIADDKPP